ncbi:MAG: addiction module protein [Candidatus Aminicenantes bacterium]|jgi:putative addiction module component (TIGR02574 family)
MTVQTKQIFEEALGLPASEKALLADQLLASLDLASSNSIDEMWAREAENRIDAYERGEIKAIPAKEVFEKIDSKKQQL